MEIVMRDMESGDRASVDALALAAFSQFSGHYGSGWEEFRKGIGRMSELSANGTVIVATVGGTLAGAVVYVPSGKSNALYFPREWATIRMLVVGPGMRGRGIGRALTLECLARAKRDGADMIGLHTSPIMSVALNMYLKIGFKRDGELPPIHGVPYARYSYSLKSFP